MQIMWVFHQVWRRGSQIEIQSCLISHPRALESNVLPPRRRWLLSCHSPHSYHSVTFRTPAKLPTEVIVSSQPAWASNSSNNTWFSHILLRLVGTMMRSRRKLHFTPQGGKLFSGVPETTSFADLMKIEEKEHLEVSEIFHMDRKK